jgi:hypothetical protein
MSFFLIEREDALTQVLEIEQNELLKIYNAIIKESDSYSLKQHAKIALYILFIENHELYVKSLNEFIKKFKIIKRYLKYNLFYFYNEIQNNYSPKNIDNKMIHYFLYENEHGECDYNDRISGIMYNKIESYNFYKKKLNKNKTIINIYKSSDILHNIIHNNNILLNDVKKNKVKINLPSHEKNDHVYEFEKQVNIIEPCTGENSTSTVFSFDEYINSQEICSNEMSELKQNIEIGNNMLSKLHRLRLNTESFIESSKQIMYEKKQELKTIMEKKFCKRTILLNVDLLVSTVNDDIINHIRCFVGNKFIKDTRKSLIQQKYSLCSRETLERILYKWTLNNLLKFENNYMYLKYDIESFDESIFYDYREQDFLLYYNDNYICDLFVNRELQSQNQTKMAVINRLLTSVRVINYYHFQKNIWLLTNKIFGGGFAVEEN